MVKRNDKSRNAPKIIRIPTHKERLSNEVKKRYAIERSYQEKLANRLNKFVK